MRNRHRNVYYATGLPGWMRLGYAPGWGGLPPGAWQMGPTYGPTGQTYGASPEEELDILRNQASALEQQLNQILKRIDEIEKAKEA